MAGIFSGPRWFYRCTPMITDMRRYAGGQPDHTCGTWPCNAPRQVCMMPRRLGDDVNFVQEALGADNREVCLDVGPVDESGWTSSGVIPLPSEKRVVYLMSPLPLS